MARREIKKEKIKYIILFIIVIIVAIICIGINQKWFNISSEINNEEGALIQGISKELENNSSLESNLLKPEDVNNEIISKIGAVSQEKAYVVRIQYKLKSLDNGNIYLYYKINDLDLIKINVNISEKKIENIEKYNDDTLLSKEVISDNLKENVQEDFESKKDKLDSENKSINVIITNTEVVINVSVD